MFLGGANPQNPPEIRPPSIKGLLRYWWRAIQVPPDLRTLKEKEAEIFGAAGEEDKSDKKHTGKSNVLLKVCTSTSADDLEQSLWNEIPHYEKLSQKTGKIGKYPTSYHGLAYFFYSALMNENRYLKPELPFELQLRSNDETFLQEAIKAFWCLAFLGGIGARNRKGGGNFCVESITPPFTELFETSSIDNNAKLFDFLKTNIRKLVPESNRVNGQQAYSILQGSKIWSLNLSPFKNWKDCLDAVGKTYRNFRDKNKHRLQETPNLGFPVLHGRGSLIMVAGKFNEKDNIEFLNRSASPLVFKVIKTKEKTYFPIIMKLNKKLIPDSFKIMDYSGGNVADPDEGIIGEFLQELPIAGEFEI